MHYEGTMTVITIRGVSEDVRDRLAYEARLHGQSLQAYVLDVLNREAAFSRNRDVLARIRRRLAARGGAAPDAPTSAELLAQAREERDAQLLRGLDGDADGAES
jgi:antitoxin FitA